MEDQKKVPQIQEPAVVFKMSDERSKAKKQKAKDRREFLRSRFSEKATG
jgi:hypothetical protein